MVGKHPDALIGHPTGNGHFVIDLDRKDGVDGWANWTEIEQKHTQAPDTLTALTQSGGYHLYFETPGGVKVKSNAGQIGLGIDVRGDGGYVILPGSTGYEWEASITGEIAPAPEWLVDLVRARTPSQDTAESPQGATVPKGQRNNHLTSVAGKLRHAGLDENAILAALRSYNADHCDPPMDDEEVCGIARSVGRYTPKPDKEGTQVVSFDPSNPLGWAGDFAVSDEEIEQIADPEWVYENLIILGHVVVIVARPNGGKTTILEWVCSQISDKYRVIYVNADISGVDAKWAHARAKGGRYELLLPDLKAGRSMQHVIANLGAMNTMGGDFSNVVMVFDTLKKMVEVINKNKARELYQTLRGLSSKGATIVLLAHTNKYDGPDGKPIFEGTGDLRADVDEMIYLLPEKHADGSMTVSTEPDKVRGAFSPITFKIDPERRVSRAPYVDVISEIRHNQRLAEDQEDVDVISAFLDTGPQTQTAIVKHCAEAGISRNRVRKLLKRYTGGEAARWKRDQGGQSNAAIYSQAFDF